MANSNEVAIMEQEKESFNEFLSIVTEPMKLETTFKYSAESRKKPPSNYWGTSNFVTFLNFPRMEIQFFTSLTKWWTEFWQRTTRQNVWMQLRGTWIHWLSQCKLDFLEEQFERCHVNVHMLVWFTRKVKCCIAITFLYYV